jgi:hypothetical protein
MFNKDLARATQIMRPYGAANFAAPAASVKVADHKTPPLTDNNYYGFAMDMAAYLRSKGLYDFVSTNLVDRIRKRKLDEWDLRKELSGDQEALGIIQYHCTDTYKMMIKKCKTSKEAWDVLAKHFTETGVKARTDLMEELIALKFDWNAGMEDYIQRLTSLKDRFESSGNTQDETLYITTLLNGLPNEFATMVQILNHSASMGLYAVIGKVRAEYKRISKKRKEPSSVSNGDQNGNQLLAMLAQGLLQRGNENVLLNLLAGNYTTAGSHSSEESEVKRRKTRSSSKTPQTTACVHCGKTNHFHLPQNCFFNPESLNYRPNMVKKIQKNDNNSDRRNTESAPVEALMARLLSDNRNAETGN